MSVVLSILQIIGWILLVVLMLVLLSVLLVLFCPVHYLIEGEWLEEKWAKAKVHWLLHLLQIKISYGDNLLYGEIRILWKKKTFSLDFTKKEIEDDVEETQEEICEEIQEAVLETEEKVIGTETIEELRSETIESEEDNFTEEQKESIISRIKGMIERIKVIYTRIRHIWQDDKNQAAVKHIKNEVIYLIKVLLPKKSKIDAVFSTGSPDTTGQLFGVLACFPIMYRNEWKMFPDFEADEAYFKGSFWAKGRIYICQIVGIALRIVFDKNCRRLYTMINKFIKWMKKDEGSEVK